VKTALTSLTGQCGQSYSTVLCAKNEKELKMENGEKFGFTTDHTDHEHMLLADFVYVRLQDCYVHVPTKRVYTADEIDRLFPPVSVLTDENSSSCH
jgi:hypothetical protein